MTIDILCRVVDNFGDIGVVYRLARALSELDEALRLRIVVDDLRAFAALAPEIDPEKPVQTVRGWTVVSGNEARQLFLAERPRAVIECFACGRPDWYEDILFDPEEAGERLIVNLEYLTAEDFAAEFHLLPSPTRSARVKKAIFMPGFAAGTGGLIIDGRFRRLREAYLDDAQRPGLRSRLLQSIGGEEGLSAPRNAEAAFWVPIFSYERNFAPLVRDLAAFHAVRPVLALVAAGRSSGPFKDAWQTAGRPFPALDLPFLPQETWDELLLAADFAVVRGEESYSRAALSGRPFLWHAYPLEGSHQMVKVRALLDRMRPFFAAEDFAGMERTFMEFNGPKSGGAADMLSRIGGEGGLEKGFKNWSRSLVDLGNLAESLLTFIGEIG